MTAARPCLSVVIVSWNTRAVLEQCLDSIRATLGNVAHEVIVVDNASADDTVAAIRDRYPEVHLIENRDNVGFARANNQGIARSKGDYILVLNPDTELLPGAVERCLAYLDQHPAAGVASGELLNSDRSFQAAYFDYPTFRTQVRALLGREGQHYRRWVAAYVSPRQPLTVDWVSGAFMLVRRAAVEQVGMFDERFFMYGEEVEWCYRFHAHGWAIVLVPDARIIHHHRQSTKRAGVSLNAHTVRGALLFFWTHYPVAQALLLTLLSFAMGVGLVVKGVLMRRRDATRARTSLAVGRDVIAYCLDAARNRLPRVPRLAPRA